MSSKVDNFKRYINLLYELDRLIMENADETPEGEKLRNELEFLEVRFDGQTREVVRKVGSYLQVLRKEPE